MSGRIVALPPPELVEKSLLQCPPPKGVALLMRQEDISRPLIHLVDGRWQAAIYVVKKNGLPDWMPLSARRRRRQRSVAIFNVSGNPLIDILAMMMAARALKRKHERKMGCIHRGLLSSKRRVQHAGPGRPRGILKSMEKPAGQGTPYCRRCNCLHPIGPCPRPGTPRWPPE